MVVIPCTPLQKQTQDTINTIKDLVEMGIEPNKICLIKNMVSDVDTMDDDFSALVMIANAIGVHVIDRPILEAELFEKMDQRDGTMMEVSLDQTNYIDIIKAAQTSGDKKTELEAAAADLRRRFSKGILRNLEKVREDLFADYL